MKLVGFLSVPSQEREGQEEGCQLAATPLESNMYGLQMSSRIFPGNLHLQGEFPANHVWLAEGKHEKAREHTTILEQTL